MNVFQNSDYRIKDNVKIHFDGNIWKYEPELTIKIKEDIPVYTKENVHLLKALTIYLPFWDGEQKIAFFYKYDNQVIGFFNICSHIKVPLDLDDNRFFNVLGNIVCKVHGAQFCPKTGMVLSGPARSPLYKLIVQFNNSNHTLVIKGFYHESFFNSSSGDNTSL
ncbi:MAG: hypothetical protein KatS3mg129_1861 [Leptospiraceae bacterium]|nr:MAG: hypothetical protein KatS3mg129_1861 [Leptospiraceae bacterium]